MDLIPYLSMVILVATLVTIVFAVFSYLAYRAREKKAPPTRAKADERSILLNPQFFKRYHPPE